MDELIESANNNQLKAALREALLVIDQLSASTGAFVREDIVERVKDSYLNAVSSKLEDI